MCFAAYLTSLFVLFLQATSYFAIPVFPFTPFLSSLSLKKSMTQVFWISAIGTLPLDLLSSDPMGIHSLSCMVTAVIAARVRQLFSSDSWIQFSVFSGILSFIQIPISTLFLFLFDRRIPFQGKWWIVDWPLLAILDAIYAAVWFIGPLAIYTIVQKSWDLYWLRKENSAI